MTRRSVAGPVVAGLVLAALSSGARPVAAQAQKSTVGLAAVVAVSDPVAAGVGPTLWFPLGADAGLRTRALATRLGERWVGRFEGAVEYRVPVNRGARPRWYLAGGVAGNTGRGGGPFLLLAIGLDFRRAAGPTVEAGVGGGARVAASFDVPVRGERRAAARGRP
ncbi:MAG: hypothetical protein AB7L66_00285 [Gemmatimonadales bacterium]